MAAGNDGEKRLRACLIAEAEALPSRSWESIRVNRKARINQLQDTLARDLQLLIARCHRHAILWHDHQSSNKDKMTENADPNQKSV